MKKSPGAERTCGPVVSRDRATRSSSSQPVKAAVPEIAVAAGAAGGATGGAAGGATTGGVTGGTTTGGVTGVANVHTSAPEVKLLSTAVCPGFTNTPDPSTV